MGLDVMRKKTLFALLLALSLIAAACGSGDDDTDGTDEGGTDTEESEGSEESGASEESGSSGGAAGVDIDAALDADLDNCVDAPAGDPIRVGMAMDFGDISGFADIPGKEAAIHMADLINCIGGVDGSPVEVEVQDIQGDPEVTARATEDLLEFGAHFLVGPPFADFGQPVLQVTEGKVPVFFAASTEPSLPDAGANSFTVSFDDTLQATAAAEYALDQGITRAITFSSPGPYFGYTTEIFTEVFEAGGGEVIIDQTYTPVDDVDFSAQVNEVAAVADGTEALYTAMLAFQLTALRGQLEGQDLNDITYLTTDAFEATAGLLEDPETIEGIVHTTHAFIEPGGRIEKLLASYEATTGSTLDSGTFAGLYVDSMLLGIQGILDCGCRDPEQIGAAVAQIDGFNGFTGEMGYAGTNGLPTKPVSVHLVVDGVDTLAESWTP